MVSPIPDGYNTATPYLVVKNAVGAIDWYKKAFDAKELARLSGPDGSLMHAEFKIGNSTIMLGEENSEMGSLGPDPSGSSGVSLYLYVENVDEMFGNAISAGATEKRAVRDQFYGDRTGSLVDPYGHTWTIGTHIEDVSIEDLQARVNEMFG